MHIYYVKYLILTTMLGGKLRYRGLCGLFLVERLEGTKAAFKSRSSDAE